MIAAAVAILLIWFGSGGGSLSFEKAFEPFLKEVIAEESRRDQAIQLTRDADENVQQFLKGVREVHAKELRALIADYDATDGQFRTFYEKGARSRRTMQQQMLDVRFHLVATMTREEWDSLHRKMDQQVEDAREKAEAKKE